MNRRRSLDLVLVVLVLVVVVSAVASGWNRPPRVDPPWFGATAVIGVPYGVEAWCLLPIEVGNLWWAFPARAIEPPPVEIPPFPFSMFARVGDPFPVPGVLILSSPNQAVFRADSDGSRFTMTAHRQNPMDGVGCL